MRRLHLFEWLDFKWFPDFIRRHLMDLLRAGWGLPFPFASAFSYQAPYIIVASELKKALSEVNAKSVVDVCSGGGGPVSLCQQRLARWGMDVDFVLTDLFPNIPAFEALSDDNSHITYVTDPVDATNCRIEGFRTMFASFHHFPPSIARRLLADAVNKNQGIGIFEFTKNNPYTILFYLFTLPLMAFVITPFLRAKCSLSRLFFTYIIPIIPFVLVWDGIVSCLRTYSNAEMLQLIVEVDPERRFRWRIRERQVAPFLPVYVTSLVGTPKVTNVVYARRSPSMRGVSAGVIGLDTQTSQDATFAFSGASSRRLSGTMQSQMYQQLADDD